jgi:hypothetical protein
VKGINVTKPISLHPENAEIIPLGFQGSNQGNVYITLGQTYVFQNKIARGIQKWHSVFQSLISGHIRF